MAIDTRRRSTLKLMSLATGAAIAPGISSATCKHGAGSSTVASKQIRGTGLIVSFAEKPNIDGSRQVIVTNMHDHAVTLSQIHPGIVSTADRQYDLNSLLANGTREFAPMHATTLTIQMAQPDSMAHSHHLQEQPMKAADSLVHVRTTSSKVNGGQAVTTVRKLFS